MSLRWGMDRKFLSHFYMRWDWSHINLSLFCTEVRHLHVMKYVSVFVPVGQTPFYFPFIFLWISEHWSFNHTLAAKELCLFKCI